MPPRSGSSPTTTSATSGAGLAPPATRAGRCSRRCPPACGRASGSGGAVSSTRPWRACEPPSTRIASGEVRGSASRSPAPSRSAASSIGATSHAARRAADAFADGTAFGEGGRVYQQAVARLLVAEGRYDEALVVLGSRRSTGDGIAIVNPAWNPWRSIKAAALYGLGRTSEAIETAEEELALLRVWGAPSFLGRALCMLGEFQGRAGLDDLVRGGGPALVDAGGRRPRPSAMRARQPPGRGGRGCDHAAGGGKPDGGAARCPPGSRPALAELERRGRRIEPRHRRSASLVAHRPADPRPDRRRPGRSRSRAAAVRHTGDRSGRPGRGRLHGGAGGSGILSSRSKGP